MSLNDMRLTPSVTAALYRSLLVDTGMGDIIEKNQAEQPINEIWKFLGNNEKNVLVVVNYETAPHLPDEELSFLTNIFSACKLTLGDVAIFNINNHKEFNYKDISSYFNSKIILLFGVDPVQFGLPIDFPHFQVQSFSDCKFLFSPALEERQHDELFKSKLWVSLRRIFGI
jgi:hypothetical protein